MNWQTEKLFDDARRAISDEGVFSSDQIGALERMIDRIKEAVRMESKCAGSPVA